MLNTQLKEDCLRSYWQAKKKAKPKANTEVFTRDWFYILDKDFDQMTDHTITN